MAACCTTFKKPFTLPRKNNVINMTDVTVNSLVKHRNDKAALRSSSIISLTDGVAFDPVLAQFPHKLQAIEYKNFPHESPIFLYLPQL